MARATPIYTAFVSGEVSPFIKGRTDVAQYYNSCETLENILIRPYGPVINTPGTRFIAEVKDSSKATRLLRFVFNRSDAFIIELGEGYFRFYTDQGQVESAPSTPYELANTYTESELFEIQYSQVNDVIYLTHKDHPPRKLTRLAADSWTLTDIDFLGGPYLDDNITSTTITPSADTGTGITLTASSGIFTANHVGALWKIKDGHVKITAYSSSTSVTADVRANQDGTAGNLNTGPGATTDWAEGAWSAERGYPARCVFHERRFFVARTDYQPQRIWGSKSFVYDDFFPGSADDDALNIPIASDEANEIQWLLGGTSLAVGTFGGEFVVFSGTSTAEPLTPSNVVAIKQTGWGSRAIQPKKVNNYIYYIQRFGRKVRELFYFWDNDNYKSLDATILAEHITESGVVDVAYQQNPDSIIWCVREDGQIATLTREIDQQVQAWSRQITEDGDGLYESIASIPNSTEPYDEVWTVVNRTVSSTTKRYIEVFENPEVPDLQDDCFYVHSGLTYNAYTATSDASVSLTLSAVTGNNVTATASGAYFNSDDEQLRIRAVDADGNTVGEFKILTYNSTTQVTGNVVYDFDSTTYSAGEWGLSVDSVSGLDHLEGKTVAVLGDGGYDDPTKTVSSGAIDLEYNYFKVQAGLPYASTLLTLPIEAGSQIGTAQGKLKKIYQVALKVYKTLGIQIGQNEDSLDQVGFRDPATLMGTPESLYTGIVPNINFRGDIDYTGQIMIKQSLPLPMSILSIIPFIETHDK